MKKPLLILSFLLPVFLFSQSTLLIGDPIIVAPENPNMRAPKITLVEGNKPIVYWGKTGNTALYVATWGNNSFNTPLEINTSGISPNLWGGALGPDLASIGNTVFLVFEEYGEGIYCIKSTDGGQTFGEPISVFNAPVGRVATLPSIELLPDGNPVISFVTTNFNEQEALYEITRSNDGGLTFLPTTNASLVVEGEEVCECCPASIAAIAADEIYLGFRNNNNNLRDIWIAKSDNIDMNFDEVADIDNTDWMIEACPQSGPDILVNEDELLSVFYSGNDGAKVYLSELNRNTMQVISQSQLPSFDGANNSQSAPSIAGSNDTIAVVWQEFVNGSFDIMMSWTTTGVNNLLNNAIVLEDASLAQRFPSIAYADGVFHIVYEDSQSNRVVYRKAEIQDEVNSNSLTFEAENDIKIVPNPFYDKAIIYFENKRNDKIIVELYHSNGQFVQQYVVNNNLLEIEKSRLNAGCYFIRVAFDNYTLNEKIIIH